MKAKFLIVMVGILGINQLVCANMIYGISNIPSKSAYDKFSRLCADGEFTKRDNAQSLVRQIQSKKFQNVSIKSDHNYYKVIVGPFKTAQHVMNFYQALNAVSVSPAHLRPMLSTSTKTVRPYPSAHVPPKNTMPHQAQNDMPQWKPSMVRTDKPIRVSSQQGKVIVPQSGITSKWYLNGQIGGSLQLLILLQP